MEAVLRERANKEAKAIGLVNGFSRRQCRERERERERERDKLLSKIL